MSALTTQSWTQNLVFCDDEIVKASDVTNILAGPGGFFPNTMYNVFIDRYAKMKQLYNQITSDADWTQNGLVIEDIEQFPDALLKVPSNYWSSVLPPSLKNKNDNIGHDVPIWLYYKGKLNESSPRVMIVGQDPLRNGHDLKDNLLLSTPWGIHSLNYQVNGDAISKRRRMTFLLDMYLSAGAVVYLTDYKKLYLKKGDGPAERLNNSYWTVKFEECLRREIALFKPTLIVANGCEASRALTGEFNPGQTARIRPSLASGNVCVHMTNHINNSYLSSDERDLNNWFFI